MPVVTFPPPWESGPNAADPAISGNFGSYTGPGYYGTGGPFGQSTINVAPLGTQSAPPIAPAVQSRLSDSSYLGTDGNVYAYDRATGIAYKLT